MKNAAIKTVPFVSVNPLLHSIFHKAELGYLQIEKMFSMLGWGDLPSELKMEIEEDVKGYIDELNGQYSTCCPFVQRRRESVDFWVNSFLDGICSAATATEALKVKSI
ncbi:MAG: hypothetical protein WD735_00815 [Balneolaceae bacterium]